MKAQEKYDYHSQKVSEAWQRLLDADKELSEISGFGDIDSVPKYKRAYADWQFAQSNFSNYVSWLRNNNVKPDDEVPG